MIITCEIGKLEVFFIFLSISLASFTEAPESITAIDLDPTMNPKLEISPRLFLLESSCFPKCTYTPSSRFLNSNDSELDRFKRIAKNKNKDTINLTLKDS